MKNNQHWHVKFTITLLTSLLLTVQSSYAEPDEKKSESTLESKPIAPTTADSTSDLIFTESSGNRTAGQLKIDGTMFEFDCSELNNGAYQLLFGAQNRIVDLTVNYKELTLTVKSDELVLTKQDTALFAQAAKQIASSLTPEKSQLMHNTVLIGMVEYYSRAPDGYEVTSRTETL